MNNSMEEASSPAPESPQQLPVDEAGGDRSVKRRKRESTVARKSSTCDVCAKTFTRHDRMMRHKGIAHPIHQSDSSVEHAPPASPTWPREQEALQAAETPAQTFVCDVDECTKSFAKKRNLYMHKYTVHTKAARNRDEQAVLNTTTEQPSPKTPAAGRWAASVDQPYKCTDCDRSFAKSTTLAQHRDVHAGEPAHKCHLCSKAFMQKPNWYGHYRKAHPNEKPPGVRRSLE